MAKYRIVEMNDLRGDGQTTTYPKLVRMGRIKTKELAQMVADRSTMSAADVMGTLTALSQVMAQQMALGYSVELEDIGTFSAKLGMVDGAEREDIEGQSRKNASSIRVKGINFKASKSFIEATHDRLSLERAGRKKLEEVTSTREERLSLAKAYISKVGWIKPKNYAEITGLGRTKAGAELRAFVAEGLLKVHGLGSHIYYTLVESI